MNTTYTQQSIPAWFGPYSDIRNDAYVMLAALLRDTPSEETIHLLRNLRWEKDIPLALHKALRELCRACAEWPMQSIHEEYERIFIGLGAGELVPYGSWYAEKQIQSTPLAQIRTNLRRFGIVRQTESFESEDHAGVLCEIMVLLSTPENRISLNEQADFFNSHLAIWMPQFFIDLQDLVNIKFYRQVAGFGRSFLQAESEYLQSLSACPGRL